jgi:biopolymer transport protein ExbD
MAELDTSGGGGHGKDGKIRSKKMSTRVDLTPMVDLAFLLITFFMLTTTMNKPSAMELNMPKKEDKPEDQQEVRECQVLNVLLDTLDQVWYYEGLKVADLQKTTFDGDAGIRKVLIRSNNRIDKECGLDKTGKKRPMICLIKLLPGSRYKNMVDILDEMDINKIPVYAIQEFDPIEMEAIENGGNVKTFATEQ